MISKAKEMHAFIEEKRRVNRISYKVMADSIDYSDTGLKRALEGERLSMVHIEKIVDKFGFRQEFNDKFNISKKEEIRGVNEISTKYGLDYLKEIPDDHLVFEFTRRYEKLSKNAVIKNTIIRNNEIEISKRVLDIVSSKDKLKEYINN